MLNSAEKLPIPKGVRHWFILPESMEMIYAFIDEACVKSDVLKALDGSTLLFAAYPAPKALTGSDDGVFVITNPRPIGKKSARIIPGANGMLWLSKNKTCALFEHKDQARKYFVLAESF